MSEFLNITDPENIALIPEGEKELEEELNELIEQYPSQKKHEILEVTLDDQEPQTPVGVQNKKDTQITKRIKTLEKQRLPEIYKNTTYYSLVHLIEHHRQDQGLSCTLATTINAMEALETREDLSEQEVAQAVGESGQSRTIDIQKSITFLKQKGLEVKPINTTTGLIETLRNGGVAMLTAIIPGEIEHEILISGVTIQEGEIIFTINNPLKSEAEKIDLDAITDLINNNPSLPNTYSITKPKSEKDTDIELDEQPSEKDNLNIKLD